MNKVLLPEKSIISSKDFLKITKEKFYQATEKEAKPSRCWFSLTDFCNLNCKYCFANARHSSEPKKNIKNELTTEEVLDVLNNIADAGMQSIMFAGGEPTLRKDLPEIIYHASLFMRDVAINTNGFFLDEYLLWELVDAGLNQIKVSIDGLQNCHDWNRGEGSYEKALQTVINAKKLGIPNVILIMTLSNKNYDDLPKLLKLTIDLGVDFTMVEFLPMGRATDKKDWCLTREQRKEIQRYLFNAQKTYGWEKIAFENRYIIAEDEYCKKVCADPSRPCGFFDFSVGCISGIYSYCITPQGKVVAGDVMTLEVGDLKREKMSNIWKNADLFKLLRNRENLKGKCGNCIYKYVCGGCRRSAYTFTKDIMGPDPNCWVNPKVCSGEIVPF